MCQYDLNAACHAVSRRTTHGCHGLAVVLVSLVLMVSSFGCFRSESHNAVKAIPFDSATWKADAHARQAMLSDLTAGKLLNSSMSEAEIVELLGPPRNRILANEAINVSPNAAVLLYYYFYEEHSFDTPYLVIEMGEDGKFLKSGVTYL